MKFLKHPFVRALKLTLSRWRAIALLLSSSLLVAGLWGANIGTLFPMVEIVFDGDSIANYVDDRHQDLKEQISEHRETEKTLNEQIDASPDAPDIGSIRFERDEAKRLADSKQDKADWFAWASPLAANYLPSTPFKTLVLIVSLLMLGTAIKLVALGINTMVVQYLSNRLSIDLRENLFRRSLSLDIQHFGENGSADLVSRVTNDVGAVTASVIVLTGTLIREPLKMIVCIGGALLICPRLLLIVGVLMPLTLWIANKLSKLLRRNSRISLEELGRMYTTLTDAYVGIRVVKAYGTEAIERMKFRKISRAFFGRNMKVSFYGTLARSNSELLGMITVCMAILGGGYLVVNRETHLLGIRMTDEPMSVGQMLLFYGLLIGASDPARKLTSVWATLQAGIIGAERVYEMIDAPSKIRSPENPVEVARPHKELRIEDVEFSYNSGPRVLKGLDLVVEHGKTIALVGSNGCGKSTLAHLLCRFEDPEAGVITLDGTPLTEMGLRDLRRRIAIVTQKSIVFDGTIEENIVYGSGRRSHEEMLEAAQLAHADEFIRNQTTDGYQTRLGSKGVRLSGGQMQRIALARAFMRKPDILILDEATSAIDVESETLIHDALRTYLKGRTGIIISHRPSSLALADEIFVIDEGRVVDHGSRSSLASRNAFVASLSGSDEEIDLPSKAA
ncbi:MAG: ABC transporter ATP-binding protein [Planctomycetota bacterium]